MAITISERAIQEIKKVMEEQKLDLDKNYLRISVSGGGCSGFQKSMTFTTETSESEDEVSDHDGLKIVIDMKSGLYLDGTKVDFIEDLNRRGFDFTNESWQGCCGCGKSFSV